MTGYKSKKAAAQDKMVVTDLDGHVVGTVRKPKKAAAIAKTIDKVNWVDHETNGITAAAFIAAEKRKVSTRYGYVPKLHPSEYMQEQPTQDKMKCQCSMTTSLVGSGCQYCNPEYMDDESQPAQEPDWKALVLEHNADCDSRCDMDACGYKGHFEFSNRRCPTCPVNEKIDVDYSTQPAQNKLEPSDPFEKWWYYEGSAPPYTHHDCEEHTKRMCQIAWNKAAYVAAQPAQEPVAYLCKPDQHGLFDIPTPDKACTDCFPVYAAPPQRPWVGLTEEETSGFTQHEMTVVKYVSKVLQEKNT